MIVYAPLVSIVVPCYNSKKFISETINSVLVQNYTNWELIIVDDCSTDGVCDVVLPFVAKDARIRFFQNEKNIGVSRTRKKAIEIANGEWVAFLDSDDCWRENKLSKQLECATVNEAEFVFTASSFIDDEGKPYESVFHVPPRVDDYRQLLKQNVISCSSVLVKRDIVLKYPMDVDDKVVRGDFLCWLQILKGGTLAFGIDEPLLVYRVRRESVSSNKLAAAMRNYRTYKKIGLELLPRLYYFAHYAVNGVLKYRRIKRK